ncbi:MAG: hypothetical protein ACRDGW_07900 [Actinomycetota bacterium]
MLARRRAVPCTAGTHPLVFWNDGGRVEWRDGGRTPSFDEVVGASGWYFTETAVVDGVTYGVLGGQLAAVELGVDDAAKTIRTFDGQAFAIAGVP